MFLSAEILIFSNHKWCYKVKQKEESDNSPVHVEVELLMKLWSLPYLIHTDEYGKLYFSAQHGQITQIVVVCWYNVGTVE